MLGLTKLKQHAQHQAQQSADFLALCNGKVTLLTMFSKTTSQKVMRGGSRASTVQTEALPEKQQAEKEGVRKNKKKSNSPKSSSLCVALYICLSFWSCFSIFLFASLCAFSSFLWSSVLLLPKQPIFPQEKGKKGGPREEDEEEEVEKEQEKKWRWRGYVEGKIIK